MDSKEFSVRISPASEPIRGEVRISGDKSVSIRRALFSLLGSQTVSLKNYGTGHDCLTALSCLRTLGIPVLSDGRNVVIHRGTVQSGVTLDCQNSGTTARLLVGMLAGREGNWTLVGDESLSKRPMRRVAVPLSRMGAEIELSESGCLPAKIIGQKLRGTEVDLNIASAQIKSALLLAGLSASGVTRIREPFNSRDHTERLLGLRQDEDRFWTVSRQTLLSKPLDLSGEVPGDISSAAFWVVAALLVPQSELTIGNVLLNPLRARWFECLRRSGADISAAVEGNVCGEPVGRITARYSRMMPLKVTADEVPGLIDEIPALAVLAATIEGRSEFYNIGELRVKESDRLQAVASGLETMGVSVEINGDDLFVNGGSPLRGGVIDPAGDHRIAMAFSLAALTARSQTDILNASCAAVSYPEFYDELAKLSPDAGIQKY